MTSALALFDDYNRQARLYPSLLALLPPLIAVLAWFPDLLTTNVGTTLVTVIASCGLLFALSVFSRSCGKRTETRLLKDWGGWPTTLWLRHSDKNLPAPTKERYRKALVRRVTDLKLPSAADESTNQALSDEAYRSATEWLKEYARGKDFPLVLKENIEYGFRRNMRGIRPFAIGAAAIALLGSIGTIVYRLHPLSLSSLWVISERVPVSAIGATLVLVVALVGWFAFVTDAWVHQAGDQYARALLAVCDTI
jgi:hypothetical protein